MTQFYDPSDHPGWYRECDFIMHTTDIDLGIPYDILIANQERIRSAARQLGLNFQKFPLFIGMSANKMDSSSEFGLEMILSTRQLRVDLFSYAHERVKRNETEMEVVSSWIWLKYVGRKIEFVYTDMVKTVLKGVEVYVPRNVSNSWL